MHSVIESNIWAYDHGFIETAFPDKKKAILKQKMPAHLVNYFQFPDDKFFDKKVGSVTLTRRVEDTVATSGSWKINRIANRYKQLIRHRKLIKKSDDTEDNSFAASEVGDAPAVDRKPPHHTGQSRRYHATDDTINLTDDMMDVMSTNTTAPSVKPRPKPKPIPRKQAPVENNIAVESDADDDMHIFSAMTVRSPPRKHTSPKSKAHETTAKKLSASNLKKRRLSVSQSEDRTSSFGEHADDTTADAHSGSLSKRPRSTTIMPSIHRSSSTNVPQSSTDVEPHRASASSEHVFAATSDEESAQLRDAMLKSKSDFRTFMAPSNRLMSTPGASGSGSRSGAVPSLVSSSLRASSSARFPTELQMDQHDSGEYFKL